jgi:hypothetical protein
MEFAAKVTTTIMLQPELRALLDDEAARLDRSRSWLAGMAIQSYLYATAAAKPLAQEQSSRTGGELGRSALPFPDAATGSGTTGEFPSSSASAGRVFSSGNSKISDLCRETLERQAAIERERAAEAARQLERVTRQNHEYFERLENGDSE